MTLKRTWVSLALAAALGVGGCGLRGPLERPDPIIGRPAPTLEIEPAPDVPAEPPAEGPVVNENGGEVPATAPVEPVQGGDINGPVPEIEPNDG